MMLRFHPSAKNLERWLAADAEGELDHDVDGHVATCDRCANRLEDLAQPVPELGAALSAMLQAPDDLVQRLGARMSNSMRNREDLQLFMELMGVPFDTVRTLLSDTDLDGMD